MTNTIAHRHITQMEYGSTTTQYNKRQLATLYALQLIMNNHQTNPNPMYHLHKDETLNYNYWEALIDLPMYMTKKWQKYIAFYGGHN